MSRQSIGEPLWALLAVVGLVLLIACANLAGLLPALRASRVDPAAGLKDRSALGSPRLRLGKVLVSVQVGLSVLLVVVAGLMIQTFANLSRVDPGFDPENLLVFRLNAGQAGYKDTQLESFFGSVRQSVVAIPGVRRVALSDLARVGGSFSSSGISIPGRSAGPNEDLQASQLIVSDSFFSTMGIRLLLGRDFGPTDKATSPKVAIVNEAFVHSFLPKKNPVGQEFNSGNTYQIV